MKIWNTVAQNVFSGCIGGLLVMSAAQAQKPGSTPVQHEIRAHKLVLVDEKNKECGELDASGGTASIRLKSGESLVSLVASDSVGSRISVGAKNDHFAIINASDSNSTITASSGDKGFGAFLSTTGDYARLFLIRNGTKQRFSAVVDKSRSNVVASGPSSSFSVDDENSQIRGSLDWGIYPNSASMTLKDGEGHEYWSQPSLRSNNQ